MFLQQDFPIYIYTHAKESAIFPRYQSLPFAFNFQGKNDENSGFNLNIKWETDISQNAYILELRGTTEYEREADQQIGLPYYNSGKRYTQEKQCVITELNNHWVGLVEIRLRIFDENGNEYCTHTRTNNIYEFEKTEYEGEWVSAPQWRQWYSLNDKCYFVLYNDIYSQINTTSNSKYLDIDSQLTTKLQFSEDIFFSDSTTTTFNQWTNSNFVDFLNSNADCYLKRDTMYYYRLWQSVSNSYGIHKAIFGTSNTPPKIIANIRKINDSDSDWLTKKQMDGIYGEMVIETTIEDSTSNYVSLSIEYSTPTRSIKYPCVISSPMNNLTANRPYKFLWQTIVTDNDNPSIRKDVLCNLFFTATDDRNMSSTYTTSVQINNSTSTLDYKYANFNVAGKITHINEYPLYPVQAISHNIKNPITISSQVISRLAQIFSNSEFVINEDEYENEGDFGGDSWGDKFWKSNSNKSYTINIYCPDCIERFEMSKKTGTVVVRNSDTKMDSTSFDVFPDIYKFEFVSNSSNSFIMYYCDNCHRYYRENDGIIKNGKHYCANCGSVSYMDVIYTSSNSYENFKFHCNNCGRDFDKEMVFHMMHTDITSRIAKRHFSMYHGYSFNNKDNQQLSRNLQLIDQTQASQSDYCQLFNSTSYGSLGIKWERGKIQNWKGLLQLHPRADIEPYCWINVPDIKYKNRYALYNDGATLHLDFTKDYQHDYAQEGGGDDDTQVTRLIDKSMEMMANNPLWTYMQKYSYQYINRPIGIDTNDLDWIGPIDDESIKPYYKKVKEGIEETKGTEVTEELYYYDYDNYLAKNIITTICTPQGQIKITKGVNDRYCYIIDGKTRVEGSLFDTYNNIFTGETIPIIPDNYISNSTAILNIGSVYTSDWVNIWKNIILALFSDIVKQKSESNINKWEANILSNSNNLMRDTAAESGKYGYSRDDIEGTISLLITQGNKLQYDDFDWGKKVMSVPYPQGTIYSYELVNVPNNCYDTIGVQIFKQSYSQRYVGRKRIQEQSGDDIFSPYIITAYFPNDKKYGSHYFFDRNKLFSYSNSNTDEMPISDQIFDTSITSTEHSIYVYKGNDGIDKFGYEIDSNSGLYRFANAPYENIVLLKQCKHCGSYYFYNQQDCTNPLCEIGEYSFGDVNYQIGCFIDVSNSLEDSLGAGKLCFAKWYLNPNDNSDSYSLSSIDVKTYVDTVIEKAQPLFTCNKDEVDINGFHFPYSEEEFNKTKKIYIRTSHGEFAFPFANTKQTIHSNSTQQMGYRNWVLQEIPGKRGRYHKKQICYNRGLPVRTWKVKIDSNSNTETGYFDPDSNCISHDYNQQTRLYIPKDDATKWMPNIYGKYCRVFDYVDITQAWCKNYEDYASGRPPFNRKSPIRIIGGIQKLPQRIQVDYWGKYFLGPYAYSSDRQRLHYYQWFKSFPNIEDKYVYKSYMINGQNSNNLPYSHQHFQMDGGDGLYMAQRIYPQNKGYMGYVPVINTRQDSDVSSSYLESNSTLSIQRYKWHSNSQSVSISAFDLQKWHYSSNRGWYYLKPNGWYTLQTVTLDRYEHYNRYWKDYTWEKSTSYSRSAFIEVTIDPFSPDFKMGIGWIMPNGYQPSKTLQSYWIQDQQGIYSKGAIIPLGTRYVYDLIKDDYISYILRGCVDTGKEFVSDKSRLLYKDKYLPFLDYRLKARFKMSRLPYFSGYPRKWHEAFETRPDIVYDYDNPLRLRGFVANNPEATTIIPKFVFDKGINNDKWNWNGYNRIHWIGSFDNDINFRIEAIELVKEQDGFYPTSTSVPIVLKGSKFDGTNYYFPILADRHAYIDEIKGIKNLDFKILEKLQSAIIDTMQDLRYDKSNSSSSSSKSYLKQNTYYKFRVKYDTSDGQESFESQPFYINREAISPATITDVTYDKWTGMVTVEFRFDDYYGRNYDVIKLEYTTTSQITELDAQWSTIPYNKLSGQLLSLTSNMYGDDISPNLLITHKLQFDIDALKMTIVNPHQTIGYVFRISSALSENRSKLEAPIFTVKMWANEFLKPAEEQIKLLGGYRDNYVWIDNGYVPDENNNPVFVQGHWEYVSNSHAPYIPGKIDDTRKLLDEAENEFQNHYNTFVKFIYKDVDAWQTYLKTHYSHMPLYQQDSSSTTFTLYEQFYYNYNPLFNGFLQEYELQDNYNAYLNTQDWPTNLSSEFLNYRKHKGFLEFYNYNNLYDLYIDEHYLKYLTDYANSNSDVFTDFQNQQMAQMEDFNEYMFDIINSNSDSRKDYYEYQKLFFSNSDSIPILVYDSNSLSYEQYFAYRGRYNQVFKNYCGKYLYPDTKYFERRRYYNQQGYDYSTDTDFLSHLTSEMPNIVLFGTRSDYIAAYLTYKKQNYVSNEGKQYARNNYMSFKVEGFTRGQRYQFLLKDLENYETQFTIANQIKTVCETDHRKNLIQQGYFCNGFLDNMPYVLKSNSTVINTCFRFRTQSQLYEGTYNDYYVQYSNSNTENEELLKTLERFKVYYRFQMDFFNTFDSQNGKPLRDIVFAVDPKSTVKETTRILAAQMDSDNAIQSVVNDDNTQSNSDIYRDKQFISTFALPWKQMPGQKSTDFVPQQLWNDSNVSSFNQIYYWRVASYNLLERPVFDTPELQLVKPITTQRDQVTGLFKHNAVLKINYASNEITQCKYEAESYREDWSENIKYYIYVCTNKKETPIWEKNYNYDDFKQISYYGSNSYINPLYTDWINHSLLTQGVVQFITDRPTYKSNSNTLLIQDNIGNFETSWVPYNPIRHKPSVIKVNGNYLMFAHKTIAVKNIKGQSYNQNLITMSRGFSSDVFGEECVVFPRYSFQDMNEVIQGALSFDNAYIRYDNNTYYLYFNVLFYENEQFITRIYRAISKDLDVWYDFKCVAPDNAGTFPCIVKTPQHKYLMFVSKNSATEKAIYGYWNSNSQSLSESEIEFSNHERLRIYEDFGYIGSISAIYQGGTVYRLYFSINGNIYYSDYDYSGLDGISNSTQLNEIEMQKIGKSFDNNRQHIINDIDDNEPTVFLHDDDGEGPIEQDEWEDFYDDCPNCGEHTYIDGHCESCNYSEYDDLNGIECPHCGEPYYQDYGDSGYCNYCGYYWENIEPDEPDEPNPGGTNEQSSSSSTSGEQGEQQVIPQEDYSNYCFNPCVIQDDHYGTPILRLYYNTYGYPYVWKNKQSHGTEEIDKEYVQDLSTSVIVINTRYLDEYEWQKINIMNELQIQTSYDNEQPKYNYWRYGEDKSNAFYPIRYADTDTIDDDDSSSYIMPLLRDTNENDTNINYPLNVTHQYIHLNWLDNNEDIQAIKMLINPVNKKIYTYSQAKWIDFNNINQTEAMMRPEYPDTNYNVNNYTAVVYVQQRENLLEKYNEWSQGRVFPDEETAYTTFLIQTYEYSDYLKWSRKGQGIYYFHENIKNFDWNGKNISQ